jgi:hypothetical protein
MQTVPESFSLAGALRLRSRNPWRLKEQDSVSQRRLRYRRGRSCRRGNSNWSVCDRVTVRDSNGHAVANAWCARGGVNELIVLNGGGSAFLRTCCTQYLQCSIWFPTNETVTDCVIDVLRADSGLIIIRKSDRFRRGCGLLIKRSDGGVFVVLIPRPESVISPARSIE